MMASKVIVAVVTDLFFAAKIREAAQRAGVSVEFAATEAALLAKMTPPPPLVIVDLNLAAVEPLGLIRRLKSDPELGQVPLLGFVSHVQAELVEGARQAGCDTVLARSAFSQNLPQILGRYAGR